MKKMAVLLAGAMLMFTTATNASALTLTISETGFATQTVSNPGVVNFSGNYGDFSIVILAGTSSLPNNPSSNKLDITNFFVTNNSVSSKTLNIAISDVGYTLNTVYPGPNNATSIFGAGGSYSNLFGSGSASATFNSYIDAGNNLFATTSPVGSWSPNPLQSSSSPVITPLTLTGSPFSMTEIIVLTEDGGVSSNFTSSLKVDPVPEPGTMVLLGAGLLGLAVYGKRRMNKEA